MLYTGVQGNLIVTSIKQTIICVKSYGIISTINESRPVSTSYSTDIIRYNSKIGSSSNYQRETSYSRQNRLIYQIYIMNM